MTEIKLRDYQRQAIDAVFTAWSGGMQRPAIVLPTGAGKTVVFSALVREFMHDYDLGEEYEGRPPGRRVMILAHRDELVDQAIAKLRAVMPGVNVGKVKATDRDVDADVMVCSVQTVSGKRALAELKDHEYQSGKIGLIITDECHHAAAASYKKIYSVFPDALQLGVTATMARGDQRGLGDVWEDVVYQKSILWMISKGYLTDVRTRQIDLKALDMGGVKSSRGDWQAGDLGRALMESEADTAIARAYREHAGDRQGIVFTPTVETAHAAHEALRKSGIRASVITGETSADWRRARYEGFRTGEIQVLVNCMVLTEGFDMPQAEVAVIARPTQSAPLYAQMVGRVLRPYPGKKEALVLDLVGASANKLRTLIDLEPDHYRTPIRDGESLAEAEIREEEEANQKVPAGSLAFELRAREVSAFETSDHAWTRTPKGVLFINCGETYVFLWPSAEAGLWDVCTRTKGEKWKRTPYTRLDLGSAMAWGEAAAEDYAAFSTSRGARWRKSAPSPAQYDFARSLGIEVGVMNRGELSAAIDVRIASRVFDPYVKG